MQDDRAKLVWLNARLREGKVSRREFLGTVTAMGVSAALASTMLSDAAKAATPKKGGLMKLAMGHGSTSDSFDPGVIENGFQWVMNYAFTNTLVELSAEGELVPSLAESWEASADAATWTFKLRKGVEFHNGKSLTAKDVVATFDYHRDENSKSTVKPLVEPIESIKVDGDHTIVFALSGGNADFPFNLNEAPLAIFPADADGKMDWKSGIGSGGYKLETFDPGVRANIVRNPNYWKEGPAHADEVELLTMDAGTARANALVTGEVHAIEQVDLKTASLLARQEGIVVEE